MTNIVVTTIEDSPGRIHIAITTGHGAEQQRLRKELTLGEMQDLHEKLTAGLWDRYRQVAGK